MWDLNFTMLMADGRSNNLSFEDLSAGDDDKGMSIDIDSLWEILGENPGPDPLQVGCESVLLRIF